MKFCIFEIRSRNDYSLVDSFDDFESAQDFISSMINFSCDFPVKYVLRKLSPFEFAHLDNYTPFFV